MKPIKKFALAVSALALIAGTSFYSLTSDAQWKLTPQQLTLVRLLVGAGTPAAPGVGFSADPDVGIHRPASDTLGLSAGNNANSSVIVNASELKLNTNLALSWATNTDANTATTLSLVRETSNVLAQRNGTSSQEFKVYNTFTNTSNYENFIFDWTANIFFLLQNSIGTGVARAIVFGTVGDTTIDFRQNNVDRWRIGSGGHLTGFIDNTYDIGASGATRPRTGYFGTSVVSSAYNTTTNCSSSAAPAVCAAAPAGSVAIAAAATTVTVNTTAVTANSQIMIQEDSSLGTKLSVTCNTTTGRDFTVTARTAATSFVITTSAAPVTNPACLSYVIVN